MISDGPRMTILRKLPLIPETGVGNTQVSASPEEGIHENKHLSR